MRADNGGEGGILALVALVRRTGATKRRTARSIAHRPVRRGAALRRRHDHAGDLGAERGRRPRRSRPMRSSRSSCRSPSSILIVLFIVQHRGTARHRRGVRADHGRVVRGDRAARRCAHIVAQPERASRVLARRTPCAFFELHGLRAFLTLGAVFLAVTGAEALYADMGHFGRAPIRIALVRAGAAGAARQLLRTGRAAARRRIAARREPVLSPGAGMGALSARGRWRRSRRSSPRRR